MISSSGEILEMSGNDEDTQTLGRRLGVQPLMDILTGRHDPLNEAVIQPDRTVYYSDGEHTQTQ